MMRLSYSLKTAAAETGLSVSHLKRAIGEGLLKAKRSAKNDDGDGIGKYVILARDLESYLGELADA